MSRPKGQGSDRSPFRILVGRRASRLHRSYTHTAADSRKQGLGFRAQEGRPTVRALLAVFHGGPELHALPPNRLRDLECVALAIGIEITIAVPAMMNRSAGRVSEPARLEGVKKFKNSGSQSIPHVRAKARLKPGPTWNY
jgi:hypothetical protein